jgi:TrmH family RNA methyltransferase
VITSPRNPHIQSLRALARRKDRTEQGRAVVTGVRLVDAVLRYGAGVEEVLALADPGPGRAVVEEAHRRGIPVRWVSGRVLESLADVKTPQPVAAVVVLPPVVPLETVGWQRLVVADGLQDPRNVGALVRTAHAAGFDALAVLPNTADPFHPAAVRASAGSCFALRIASARPQDVLARGRVWLADPSGEVDYREADYRPPVALVFGSEAAGARHVWPGARTVRIPVAGAESLNVNAAAAVLCYEARRAWTP